MNNFSANAKQLKKKRDVPFALIMFITFGGYKISFQIVWYQQNMIQCREGREK